MTNHDLDLGLDPDLDQGHVLVLFEGKVEQEGLDQGLVHGLVRDQGLDQDHVHAQDRRGVDEIIEEVRENVTVVAIVQGLAKNNN